MFLITLCVLFFSCRRRHTRCLSDWSSDVCSSDLAGNKSCYSEVHKKCARRDGLSSAATRAMTVHKADANGSEPSPSQSDVHHVSGSPDRKSTRPNSSHLGIS